MQPGRIATTTSDATDGLARSQTCEGLLAFAEPPNAVEAQLKAFSEEARGHQKKAKIGDDHTTDLGDDDEGEEGYETVRGTRDCVFQWCLGELFARTDDYVSVGRR